MRFLVRADRAAVSVITGPEDVRIVYFIRLICFAAQSFVSGSASTLIVFLLSSLDGGLASYAHKSQDAEAVRSRQSNLKVIGVVAARALGKQLAIHSIG